MRIKTKRAKGGRNSSGQKAGGPAATASQGETQQPEPLLPPELSPLDYVLKLMRDETQPHALRAAMAKAALPYLHPRDAGTPPPEDKPADAPPMSDLEVARRIAHILLQGEQELDAQERAKTVDKPENTGLLHHLAAKTA